MKKVFLILLVLCVALSIAFAMAACNDSTKPNGTDDNGNGSATGTFDYQASAVAGQLDAMRLSDGYLIRYRATGTEVSNDFEEVTLGAKGNVYYVGLSDEEYYYDVSNAEYAVFYDKEEGGAWHKRVMYYGTYYTKEQALNAMQSYFNAHSAWLTYYQSFTSSMSNVTKSTGTVAGRNCDKFTFSAAALTGKGLSTVSAQYTCYVDKATSICLKWEASATVDGKTESYGMECVEFNANPTFTLPTVSEANTTVTGREDGNEQGQGENGNEQGEQGGDEQGEQGVAGQGGTTIATDYPNIGNASIVNALVGGGFRVTYKIGASIDANGNVQNDALDTYTLAAKGNKFYVFGSGTQAYYDFGESTNYFVEYRLCNGNWERTNVAYGDNGYYSNAEEGKQSLLAAVVNYMTMGTDAYVRGMTKSADTYLSRNADKYTKHIENNGEVEDYIVRIDKQSGVKLFFYHNISGYGTVSHIATEFSVGADVTLPQVEENTDEEISARHDPDLIDVFAAIKQIAESDGITIQMHKIYDGSRVSYELDWIGDKIQYVETEETLDTYDTIYYNHYLIDLSSATKVDVYQYVKFETGYQDEFGSYWLYESYDADAYDYDEFSELIYILSNYSSLAYTAGAYEQKEEVYTYEQTRMVDEYEIEGTIVYIDVETDALLYLKYAEDSEAYVECDEIRYNPTNVDIAFPMPTVE